MEVEGHICGMCNKIFATPCQLRQHKKYCGNVRDAEVDFEPIQMVIRQTKPQQNEPSPWQTHQQAPPRNGFVIMPRQENPKMPASSSYRATYTCKICNKLFINYGSYRRHLRMHGSGRRYACRVCNKGFFRRYMCIQHEEKCHGTVDTMATKKNLGCFCGDTFKTASDLYEHTKAKHTQFYNVISTASSNVANSSDQSRTRDRDPPFLQEGPKKATTMNSALNQVASNIDPLLNQITSPTLSITPVPDKSPNDRRIVCVCDICLQMFDDQVELEQHKCVVHQVPSDPASDNASRLESIVRESLKVTSSSAKVVPIVGTPPSEYSLNTTPKVTYTCDKCRKSFIHKSSYMRHKKMHTGVRPYTCEFCCFSFFRSEALNNHKQKHVRNPQYRCYVCLHKAKNAETLKVHFKVHTQSEISEAYRRQNWLRLSDKSTESASNRPIYVSRDASVSSKSSASLTPKNSYSQPLASGSDGLYSSSRKTESALKTYSCNKCGRQFDDHLVYSQHVLEHRGISSLYVCKICGKQLKNVEYFELHLRMQHRNGKEKSANSSIENDHRYPKESFQEHDSDRDMPAPDEELTIKPVTSSIHSLNKDDQVYFIKDNKILDLPSISVSVTRNSESTHLPLGLPQSSKKWKYRLHKMSHNCMYCEKRFLTMHDLILHLSNDHPPNALNGIGKSKKAGSVDSRGLRSQTRNYKCANCNEASNKLNDLLIHISQCKGTSSTPENSEELINNKLYGRGTYKQCSRCKKQFCSYSSLLGHVCVVQGRENVSETAASGFACALCNLRFDTPSDLEQHIGDAHCTFDVYFCPICSKAGSRQEIEKHAMSHMAKIGSAVALNKDLASILFNRSDLVTPEVRIEPLDAKNVDTEEDTDDDSCDSRPPTPELVIEPVQLNEEPTSATVDQLDPLALEYCIMCDETFPSDLFEMHLRNHHLKSDDLSVFYANPNQDPKSRDKREGSTAYCAEKPTSLEESPNPATRMDDNVVYSCDSVEEITVEPSIEVFSEIAQEQVEQQKGSEPSGRNQETESLGSLMDHINGLVSSGDLFQAQNTRSNSGSATKPSVHIWSIRDENYYKCSECGRRFVNQSSFYRHRRWHQGLMKYSCPYCPRLFYRKDQYDKHIFSHRRQAKQQTSATL